MQNKIEKDIQDVLKKIELMKDYKSKFDSMESTAWNSGVPFFSNASSLVSNQYDSEIKKLRLTLCQLRGE